MEVLVYQLTDDMKGHSLQLFHSDEFEGGIRHLFEQTVLHKDSQLISHPLDLDFLLSFCLKLILSRVEHHSPFLVILDKYYSSWVAWSYANPRKSMLCPLLDLSFKPSSLEETHNWDLILGSVVLIGCPYKSYLVQLAFELPQIQFLHLFDSAKSNL